MDRSKEGRVWEEDKDKDGDLLKKWPWRYWRRNGYVRERWKLYVRLIMWPCSSSLFFCNKSQHHPAWQTLDHDVSLHIVVWNERVMLLLKQQCKDEDTNMHAQHPFTILKRTLTDSVQGYVSAPSHRQHSNTPSVWEQHCCCCIQENILSMFPNLEL